MNQDPYERLTNPTDFYSDTLLDENPDFFHLKQELQRFYQINFKTKVSGKNHSFKWSQNLAWSLHLLLTEILLTEDQEKQSALIIKAKSWYADQIKSHRSQIIPKKTSADQELKIISPELIPRSLSNHRTNKLYVPSIERKSRRELILSAQKTFEKMKKYENLHLNSSFEDKRINERHKLSKTENKTKESEVNENKNAEIDSFVGGKDEDFGEESGFKLPKVHDFRSISHKSKYLQQKYVAQPIFNRNPVRFQDIEEVNFIKGKLAVRNQTVRMANLEYALINSHIQPLDTCNVPFPRGGERLLKYKKRK